MSRGRELRSCAPIGNATPQQTSDPRNSKCNLDRNTKRKRPTLLEIIRNRKRNNSATGSCARQVSPPISAQQQTLNRFVRLVRSYGTEYGVLLHPKEIETELDDRDIAHLLNLDRGEKQDWAELMAYRLTRNWTSAAHVKGNNMTDQRKIHGSGSG
jgi:hypothetical protein